MISKRGQTRTSELPLIVDLDRTLVRTDIGVESLAALFFQRPPLVCLLPIWLLRGLAFTKRRIVEAVRLDYSSFPENSEVVAFVRAEQQRGRAVLLVTASDQRIADECAARFGCFSEAIGSDGTTNLKGNGKAEYLVERFGVGNFCYAGDSHADLAVWDKAGAAIVVDYSGGERTRAAAARCEVERSFPVARASGVRLWSKQLRIHQWAKNLLLVLPLLLAHEFFDYVRWMAVFCGFMAFSLAASSVYILNDIADLAADRAHPIKRMRPLAAGSIKVESGLVVSIALLLIAFVGTLLLVPQMLGVLALYFGLTSVYTWWGKEQLALDTMMLAALYCVRIVAGGVVAAIPLSTWLLTAGGFLFVSLACVKRVAELTRRSNVDRGDAPLVRRAYAVKDLPVLTAVGVGTGLLAVLVCALYFSSAEVTALYRTPSALFSGVIPILTFWMMRLWLLGGRGVDALEDPVLFAVTDRVSLCCGALVAGLIYWAV